MSSFKLTSLIFLLIVFNCCKKAAENPKSNFNKENKIKKTTLESKIDIKDSLPSLEFNLIKKNPLDSLGNFILHTPDTLKLKELLKNRQWSESLSYLYLINYYEKDSTKDSIKYYEWDSKSICSFNQKFKNGIKYSVWECKEAGGISETIELPKLELKKVQQFIELLFFEDVNSWKSKYKYEPEEAGCYYEIKQLSEKTIIDIFCGC